MPSLSDRLRRLALTSSLTSAEQPEAGPSTIPHTTSPSPSDPPPAYRSTISLPLFRTFSSLSSSSATSKSSAAPPAYRSEEKTSYPSEKGKGKASLPSTASADHAPLTLESLPPELLHRIFHHLPPPSIRALSLTCRALREPAQQAVWQTVDISLPQDWQFQFRLNTRAKDAIRTASSRTGEPDGWQSMSTLAPDFYHLRVAKLGARIKDVRAGFKRGKGGRGVTRKLVLEPQRKHLKDALGLLRDLGPGLEELEIRPYIPNYDKGKVDSAQTMMARFNDGLSGLPPMEGVRTLSVVLGTDRWEDELSRVLKLCPKIVALTVRVLHELEKPLVPHGDPASLPQALRHLRSLTLLDVAPQHFPVLTPILVASHRVETLKVTGHWLHLPQLNLVPSDPAREFTDAIYFLPGLKKLELLGEEKDWAMTDVVSARGKYWKEGALKEVEELVVSGYAQHGWVVPNLMKIIIPSMPALRRLTILTRKNLWASIFGQYNDVPFISPIRTKLRACPQLTTIHLVPESVYHDHAGGLSADPRKWQEEGTGGVLLRSHVDPVEGEEVWMSRRLGYAHTTGGNEASVVGVGGGGWEEHYWYGHGWVKAEIVREAMAKNGLEQEWWHGERGGEFGREGWKVLREWRDSLEKVEEEAEKWSKQDISMARGEDTGE